MSMHQVNSKWKKGGRSFFLSKQPLYSHWRNKGRLEKTIDKIFCWPTGYGSVTLPSLYVSGPLPHTFSTSYSPPLSLMSVSFIFTFVALFILQPLLLSLLLSAVQSPHSACLQAVFIICLNYSGHFLLFFFVTQHVQ